MIYDFSIKSKEINSKLLINDIKIEQFLQKNIVKNHLSMFNIEINSLDIPNEISKKKTSDISPFNYAYLEDEQLEENDTLLISEKSNKVFLPYTKQEILLYLEQYPDEYNSSYDVIHKEFVLSLDYYIKHPVIARFRETYSLIRDRESKSVIDAFKYALDIMLKSELNPTIIAACKTQEQLENYLSCLEKNKLEDFKDFKIKFEINPL